ncbi:hypothetical protein JW992_09030, partial [candidate division KSB1 bacterium]|nr:hypothetical protein [candidate division KSB1 bacterium]
MKKQLLFTLLLTLALGAAWAATWTTVSEPDIPETLNDIFFVSETDGYAVGNDGAIYFTQDSGDSWKKQECPVKSNLLKVYFVGTQTGWVGTKDGSVLLTTDGGANWTEVSFADLAPHITFSYFRSLYFVDKNVGHLIAGKFRVHYVMKTTDGGQTWAIKDSLSDNTTQSWYDIEFYGDGKYGAIVGDKIYTQRYTNDGGETWAASDTIRDANFR